MNLKYDTKWIAEKLPPIERVWRRSEPDSYGASYLIAEQTERKKPPVSFAHWRHGWNYLNPIIHPRLLGGDPGLVHLMTTAEQVQILNNFGYKKVPRHFEEAILLHVGQTSERLDSHGWKIDPQTYKTGDMFMAALKSNPVGRPASAGNMAPQFGNTYYYYYMFNLSGVGQ